MQSTLWGANIGKRLLILVVHMSAMSLPERCFTSLWTPLHRALYWLWRRIPIVPPLPSHSSMAFPIVLLAVLLWGAPVALWAAPLAMRSAPVTDRAADGAAGWAASVSMMTQAADMVAGHGMNKLLDAALVDMVNKGNTYGLAGFGAIVGGASTYQTGSQVDVRGYSLITGLGKRFTASNVNVLLGAFFETGSGSYNTYSDANTGWGNSTYSGGGILSRVEFTDNTLIGFYTEASLRMGGLHSSYKSDGFPPADRAKYTTDATYYGLHAGLGYILLAFDDGLFDFYSKYFWTHTTANDVTVMDKTLTFDAVNSHRIRSGARFSYGPTRCITPYVEAAWEYEFDGKVRSAMDGQRNFAHSLGGSSGVGALGIVWKPVGYSVFSIELGAQGHVGARRGLGGILQLQCEF